MRKSIEDVEPLIPLSVALWGLKPEIPAPAHAHLTGAVARLLIFPEGTWAEIEIDDAPPLYRGFRVPIPLHNEDGTITRLHKGEQVSILVRPRL